MKLKLSLIQLCMAVSVQRDMAMYGCFCMCNDGCGMVCRQFGSDFEGTAIRNHNHENVRPR